MATTVGETISSKEMAVSQFDKVAVGATVDALSIKLDQGKFEEYLSSAHSSGAASRKSRKAKRETKSEQASALKPRPALTWFHIWPCSSCVKQHLKSERKISILRTYLDRA